MKHCCNADPAAMGSPKGIVQPTFSPPSGYMKPKAGSDRPPRNT